MTRFLLHAVASAVGFWIASQVISGVHVGGVGSLLAAGVVLGVINALVRPILILLTLPLTIITLGLFLLVVNAVTVSLAVFFIHGVRIDSFWHAILVAVIVGVTGWLANVLIGSAERQRRRR